MNSTIEIHKEIIFIEKGYNEELHDNKVIKKYQLEHGMNIQKK